MKLPGLDKKKNMLGTTIGNPCKAEAEVHANWDTKTMNLWVKKKQFPFSSCHFLFHRRSSFNNSRIENELPLYNILGILEAT